MQNIDEFNIEKVESLDFESIKQQLFYIFKEEEDVVNFVNFLKNIKNFVNLSNDKRHMTLIDLGYFKSQIQIYENKIALVIKSRRNVQTKKAIKKAKSIGEKINETSITYNLEEDDALTGLEELHALVKGWAIYMEDLYYMCGQTNKNLGGIS